MMPKTQTWRSCLVPAAIVLLLSTVAAEAQETREQELERQLRERNKVILELLERVEALERRVGVQRPAAESIPEPDATPTAGAEKAEETEPAPGTVVVDETEAERALERSLTREGALLLPSGIVEIEPGFTFARREERIPTLIMSGGTVLAGETERNTSSVTADLALRLGLPWDSQLEIGLPYRWREVETVTNLGFTPIDATTESGAGAGDVRVGLAKTLFREGLWRPDLVGRVTWNSDTGDESDNGVSLGGGFEELRGSLSAIKRQDPIAFVGGLSYQHTFEADDVQPGEFVSASLGSFIALSPETSVRLLLSGGYQDEVRIAGNEVAGSDRVVGTFAVGGSMLLAPGTLLNLSAGIGLTDDADDFTITVSLPIRFGGPLF